MTTAKQSKSQGSFDSLTETASNDELAVFDPDETTLRNGQTTDLVRLYLQDIGRVPLLERDEELTEARKVQNYIQLLEKRQEGAEAGDEILAEFLSCINVHDRLAIELGCRPSLNRWAQEMDLERAVLRDIIRQGKQHWAEQVGLSVKELDSILKAGAKAKEHMIQANLRLVVSVAKKYQNRGLELLDLIQEGTLGLERAVDKFDPTKGYRFSTYAYWWIRQGITRAIATQSRTIRLPVHVTEKLNKIKKAQRQISQTQGCTPSLDDVAQALEMTPEQVREVLQKVPRSVSLEIRVGKDRDTELGDLLETQDASPEENLVRESLQRDLHNLLTELTDREREVIQLRYGLGDGKTYSLAEIGRMLELSRERVRQIEAKALQKLRQPKRRNIMRDYLDTLS
ncbi:RNA polymerase sigma factor SigC [Picosynechococcus sp. NKBG042902]|uniref:RNA polymerase sigma factor SigC n=1 Tax=Picosynechococcus sp. NKBG042902 TaxID=490193 RepID=UPI0004AA0162|nr:RNA polymerase sigma factor SigC [Picosynechococcus sp. NKBG042902]